MTDEQLGIFVASLLQLHRGFRAAVHRIVEQEKEIIAIRSILERKGIAPPDELDRAREEVIRRLEEGFSAISKRRCLRIPRHRPDAEPRPAA